MSGFEVSLSNCDSEPIHIPGKIQSHGFMFAVDRDFIIRFFSDNLATFMPLVTADLLGRNIGCIEPFIDNSSRLKLLEQLLELGRLSGYEQINPYPVTISGKKYHLILSRSAEFELLEFEPDRSGGSMDVQKMIGRSVAEMLADKNLQSLLNNTAVQVRQIIHYDRVMVYRFAADDHGEVVAEARNENLESWLNLHYPASDIPRQARELYKLNLTRLIADVNSDPAPISTDRWQKEPLDLSWSQLRAVSPIHIQYLKNMGVASSFSISLLYKGQLWGLVACHNYTPKFIDFKSRESAKLIGQILSSALEFRQDEENQLAHDRVKAYLEQLGKYLQTNENLVAALTSEAITILDLTRGSGAALIYEKKIVRIGTTPGEDEIRKLVEWATGHITETVHPCTNLAAVFPPAAAYSKMASGVLVLELTKELNEYIFWFKPERIETIKWAGNPGKPTEFDQHGLLQISPRHSFEVWLQMVKGTSEIWYPEELQAAARLKDEIIYAINLKAGALRLLNEKLRIAYDELDSFSYTISHDLKNPIATIKGYSQLLAFSEALDERERSMVSRIVDQASRMNVMITEILSYSKVGRQAYEFREAQMEVLIEDIVKDLQLIYDAGNLQITIGPIPNIYGDATMLLQVFSNLIGNAVKFSQHATPPKVHIEGYLTERECIYSIRDNGLGIDEKDIPKIFDLFNRMDNVAHIEGSGVGLAIVKRIVERHKGRIWVESELGKGSIFYVGFMRP